MPDPILGVWVETIELRKDLTYSELPTAILDCRTQVLISKEIPLVKLRWGKHSDDEATWELEETIRRKYPHLFKEMEIG